MVSADRWFIDDKAISDVKERHRKYGQHVDALDIIVQNTKRGSAYQLSNNVSVYPTNSFSKFAYIRDTERVYEKNLKEKKYDLIVTQDPFLTGLAGLQLKKRLKAKLLVHLHGDFLDNKEFLKERFINRWLIKIANHVLEHADALRVMSRGQKEKLISKGYAKKIEVIATPVDIERFSSASPLSVKEWPVIVVHVGRKDRVKDFDTLFNAMKIVFKERVDVGLYLVGNYLHKGFRCMIL